MIQVLDLADKDLKIIVTNMLNKIKEKMDNIDEMLENSTIELKSMKNNQMYILELDNAIYEIKNLMVMFSSRLDRADYRIISEPEEIWRESIKTLAHREEEANKVKIQE